MRSKVGVKVGGETMWIAGAVGGSFKDILGASYVQSGAILSEEFGAQIVSISPVGLSESL